MRGWRTALRMARREVRRAKGRSALVVAMIMLPVAALAFLAVIFDTFTLTPDERTNRIMGAAQAQVSWQYGSPVQQVPNLLRPFPVGTPTDKTEPTDDELLAQLPPGSRAIRDRTGSVNVHTAAGTGALRARAFDYTDPLASGIYRQLSGTAPANSGEVALTLSAAERLGVGVGGSVRLTDGTRSFRVVGTVEDVAYLKATTILLHPQAMALPELTWLVGMPGPLTWAQVKDLNARGLVALSRQVLANPPSEQEKYPLGIRYTTGEELPTGVLTLAGGLAMLEVVLLAGPAFAVGARRRQRELAQVSASGGAPSQVRRIVLADGVVLGSVAALAGIVLGVALAAVTHPVVEDYFLRRSGEFRIYPVALAILAGAAVLTGLLAALVPAWISSRQDVVTALAGRRGITRSRRRWPILGVVLAGAGAAVLLIGASQAEETIILAGLIIVELGLVLCTPAIVGLVARIGRWLPVAPRIALRDTSRNRTAAAPAISAVMAAVVGSVVVSVVLMADNKRAEAEFSGKTGDVAVYAVAENNPDAAHSPAIESAMRTMLPVDQVHRISLLKCEGRDCFARPRAIAGRECPWAARLGTLTTDDQRAARADPRCDGVGADHTYFAGTFSITPGPTVIIEPEAAAAVANLSAEDGAAAAAALRSGAIVVDDARYLEGGRVTLSVQHFGTDEPFTSVTGPGFVLPHRLRAPMVLMTKDTARSLGFGARSMLTFATTSRMPTVAEQDRLQAALGGEYSVDVARGQEETRQLLVILAIVTAVIALGAAGMATGLAAADGRADLGTLAAVGASPRLRRALSLSQSGVIAGLGSVLGAVAGLGASTAALYTINQRITDTWPAPLPYPIGIPWLNLAVAVVLVPAMAMLGAGLLTRSRLPIERRL